MNSPPTRLGTIAAAVAAAIIISGSVAAHSGEWGIFPDAPQSWPGAGLHIRGDLPSTGPIDLVLVGPDSTTAFLATIEDAPNGHFETTVTVPAALSPGAWELQARAPGMESLRAPLTLVAPPPPGADDDAAEPDPSNVAGVSVGPAVGSAPASAPPEPLATSAEIDLVPLVAGGLAVVALAVLLRRTRGRAPSR